MEEETNIIPFLEKANKYIIVLNKSKTEGISKLKELYSPYFPELPTIVTNSYEYVQSIKVIEENKSLLKSDTKSGINPLASPSVGAPVLKYGDVNTEATSPGEVKGLNN